MADALRGRPAGPPAAEARGRSGGVGRTSSPVAEEVATIFGEVQGSYWTAGGARQGCH